jgi:hypothetical protein
MSGWVEFLVLLALANQTAQLAGVREQMTNRFAGAPWVICGLLVSTAVIRALFS